MESSQDMGMENSKLIMEPLTFRKVDLNTPLFRFSL